MLWAWGVVLSCLLVFLVARTGRVVASEQSAQTYDIGSAEDFAAYSEAYRNGERNPHDTLNISIQSGTTVTDRNFISIGTAGRPFAGTLNIPTSGIDVFHLFDCPLFDYVSTDLTITGGGVIKIMREMIVETPPEYALTSGALFANHVVAGTNPANWSITLLPLNEGTSSDSFAGLIGSIADDCAVTVTFTNTAAIPIVGTGDVGYICGTLGDDASLTVTTAGSGDALSVSTTGGHAGGIVGAMGEGAILTLKSANNTRVNNVSTTYATGYAGGIVGYVSYVTSSTGIKLGAGVVDYAVSGRVTGGAGAGGLFGYYRNYADNVTFDLLNTYSIASGMNISSSGNTGGVFGYLINNGNSFAFDGNASGSEVFTVSLSGGTSRGGVAGRFTPSALTDVLSFTDTSVRLTANTTTPATYKIGGLIGDISDHPAYVSISGVSVTSVGTSNGNTPCAGLISNAGSNGSFIDVSGNVTVSGSFWAGLIETFQQGVLRIAGTTDLSSFSQHSTSNLTAGTIVRTRGRSLIYALGNGEDAGWTLKRRTATPNRIDDVVTWGEVLRLDGSKLSESDLFTVNMTAHTVTVKSGVTTIADEVGFAKTALNIQLGNAAAIGSLQFQTPNQSSTLLSSTLTLSGDIDLSGTGLTGMTRDDGVNGAFSGTFDGDGHVLTFATGEVYGLDSAGNALPGSSIDGYIRRHRYFGLFAKTAGATFTDLTLEGYFQFIVDVDETYAGGVSAYATGGLTLTDLDVTALTFNYSHGSALLSCIGGAAGYTDGNSLNISVTDGAYRPTMTDTTTSGITTGSGGDKKSYVGGVIGYVGDGSSQTVSFDTTTIGITYTKTANSNRESIFGSAIGATSDQEYAKNKRQITLTDVDVNMSANAGVKANKEFGGVLGTLWLSSDVTVDEVDVVSASITESNSAATNFGGLVHTATGHWDVQDLTLTAANFDVTATGSTFGFLTNRTSTSKSALYLELDNTGTHYDIGGVNALTFTGSTGTFTAFDEIAADTRFSGQSILRNGNSVVSIQTSDDVINTSGSYNTYLNKTAYGKSVNGAINGNARYYYNVGDAVTNIGTAKYNLFVWSVKQYAHSSLSEWFGSPSSTFTGTIDLTGLSYYPVDLADDVAFSSATVKLDNITMEANVKYAYTTDGGTRTTRSASQHYLMHAALFLNATGNITATGSPAGLTLMGNVPKISNDICGFLVAGTLGGTDSISPTELDLTDLVINGVYVSNGDARFTDSTYAPLLVNKIGRNTNVTVAGATQTGYGSDLAASSLIGDAGNTTAHGIRLTFTGVVFDGRNNSSTDLPAGTTTSLNGVYGTSKSVFSRATLLNSFKYAGESSGTYIFEIDEDWNTSTHAAIHHVTYGYEITTSVEHAGKQDKYSGSTTVYTDPSSDTNTSSPYNFTTYFLPYVYETAAPALYKHELSVNLNYSGEITGFGKYDKPYLIDNGEKLKFIAQIINGDTVTNLKIQLPGDLTSFNYTATGYGEYLYTFGASTFTSSNGGADVSNDNVRRYLAGAYYAITDDIELPADYEPLGQTTAANPEYAFHGVVLGFGAIRKITNLSMEPLVYNSSGCVVKNLVVHVATDRNDHSHVIELTSGSTEYKYASGQASYGALIRQILGGDNFIDNVKVTFETGVGSAVTFSLSPSNDNQARLMPVGGYVGTLVNGGLIFRNMKEDSDDDGVYEPYVGLTAATFSAVSDAGYLYVNPVIGRVLAGYAFCEEDDYAVTSGFSNGTKNYALSDLDDGLAKLTISYSSNKFTITIPNGQAMYVLGAIVNCGASSASYNASSEQPYAELSDQANDTFWQAYRICTETRVGATYDGVGTSSGADYNNAALDKYDMNGTHSVTKKDSSVVTLPNGTLKGIPYIIRTYTAKNGNVYFARALTSNKNTNIISVTGDCDVAAGFRGIGSIYSEATSYSSDRVHLGIDSMSGTGSPTITLHMSFAEYDGLVTAYRVANGNTYLEKNDGNMMFGSNAGFGLFNRLYMTGTTGYIEGFTLSGSVWYGLRQASNGAVLSYTLDNVKDYAILNVGGLAGIAYYNSSSFSTGLRVRNVSLSALSIEGPKFAGGLIGCYAVPKQDPNIVAYITECPVSTTTVRAGKAAGGYIGYALVSGNSNNGKAARLLITGDTTLEDGVSRKTTVAPTAITVFGPTDAWTERFSLAAGGLIGIGDVAYTSSVNRNLVIQHMKVVGGVISATRSSETDMETRSTQGLPAAGGIVGKIRASQTSVTDCEILHVDLNADVTGGVIGYSVVPKSSGYNFERITIDGDKGDSTVAAMAARVHTGGVVGEFYVKEATTFTFADIKVTNYDFTSEYTGNAGTAGGVIGNVFCTTSNKARLYQFKNVEVTDCTMTVNTTSSATGNRKGVGGLFGALSGYNNTTTYTGYNFLVKDVTFAGSGTGSAGAVVGNNVDNKAVVKLVGVSATVDPGTKTLGNTEYNNANGYVVYADYSQTQTNTAFTALDDGTTGDDNCTNATVASPYVTANPDVTVGGKKIVGDGVADSVANLPVQTILSDFAGGDTRYAYAAGRYYSGNSGDTNAAVFNAVKGSALVMFSSETLGYDGTDLPVLMIETTEENTSHRIVNSYLRLLTNTRFDFGSDVAGKYQVVIYNMSYDAGTFTPTYGDASLKRINGKFRMINTAYDSGKVQFSLIDVRFFDPTDGTTVAYHLYVPVFVKKVLTFEFDVAAQSGTTYLESRYTSLFGQRLIANVGAPITLYFRYTYSRTAAEWETAINGGETPHRHYAKQILLQKANNNAVLKDFDEDTILVLVDKNDGGKPYYATVGDALSGETIDLSAFRSGLAGDGEGGYVLSGDYFEPKDFADMLSLSVRTAGDGRTMIACPANAATVTVSGQGYRPANDSELEAGEGLVAVSVGAIAGGSLVEKYYLSVFTEADADYDLFHYFLVTSPSALIDGVTYPARIADATDPDTTVHLVMGKIFDHSVSTLAISSRSNVGPLLMTSGDNDTLIVNLSVQIGISSDLGALRNEVRSYVSTTGFYQSFLLYLTRHEGSAQNKAILGNPTVSGSYAVDHTLNGVADEALGAYGGGSIHVNQSYAEFVTGNLGSEFAVIGNYTVEVNAEVRLQYLQDGAVFAQFPGRNGEDDNGVSISASSNIAFSPTATSFSKNSISRNESGSKLYYSEADVKNATLTVSPYGDNEGDYTPYGINALNDPPETLNALLSLNYTSIIDQVRGQYADAVVTVTLRQKQSNGSYGNSDIANIAQYIPSLSFGESAATTAGHPSYYSAVIDAENLTEEAVEILFPQLSFHVKTGSEFESAGLTYGNYRLTVSVVLRDAFGEEISASKCSEYVIYTNAKVVASFIVNN